MIKKLAITGTVVVAGYLGATWYVGTTAKEHIESRIDFANATVKKYLGDFVSYSLENYQSGLFTSTATQRLNINLPDFKKHIDIDFIIHNGPLPWAELSQGKFALKRYSFEQQLVKNEFLEPLFKLSEKPFYGVGSVDFSNVETGTQHITAFNIDTTVEDAHIVFDFGGVSADYTYATEPFKLISLGKIPKLNFKVTEAKNTFELNTADWALNSHYDFSDGRTNTSTEGQVGTLKYTLDDLTIDLNELSISDKIIDDGKLINILTQSSAKEFKVDGLSLGGLDYDTSYEKIDSSAAKQLFGILMDIVKEVAANPANLSEEKISQLLTDQSLKLGALTIALFNHGPGLTYGPIRLTNPKGSADISIKLDFLQPKLSGFTDPSFDAEAYIMSLINGVSVDVSGNAEWFAEFLPKITELVYKYSDEEKIDLTNFDFTHISELLESGLVDSQLFKKEGKRIALKIHAKAADKQSISTLEEITINGEQHSLDAALDLLNERADKAADILDSNGYIDAMEILLKPLNSNDYTYDEELGEHDEETLMDCPEGDQECIEALELEKALKQLEELEEQKGLEEEQEAADPALAVCDPSDQACIDSFKQTGQVMSDEDLAKILCKEDDAECLELFRTPPPPPAPPAVQEQAAPAQ